MALHNVSPTSAKALRHSQHATKAAAPAKNIGTSKTDSARKAIPPAKLPTNRTKSVVFNPLVRTQPASNPKPCPVAHNSIWMAIAAATVEHKRKAQGTEALLTMSVRMGQALTNATTKYHTAVAAHSVTSHDASVASSHQDSGFFANNNVIGWVVAAVTIVGCMVLFTPLIGAVAGVATVLMSDDISVDGKPLLNYILLKCHADPLGNKSLITTVSDLVTTKIIHAHSEGSLGGWETGLNLLLEVAVPLVLGVALIVLVVVAVVVAVVALVAVIFAVVMAVVAIAAAVVAIVGAAALLLDPIAALLLVIPAIATVPLVLAPIGL